MPGPRLPSHIGGKKLSSTSGKYSDKVLHYMQVPAVLVMYWNLLTLVPLVLVVVQKVLVPNLLVFVPRWLMKLLFQMITVSTDIILKINVIK